LTAFRCIFLLSFLLLRLPPSSPLFPYTTLFRSILTVAAVLVVVGLATVISPDTWLWPAATGGSLRHWIVGAGLGLVGWCLAMDRSEEHTSELQSRFDLVCRLLLEKKK